MAGAPPSPRQAIPAIIIGPWYEGMRAVKPERLHGRVLGLDVARSGAIGLVVLAHYSLALRQWFNSDPLIYGLGYFGVELFFALSGFLIGGIVIRSVLGRRDPGAVPAFWLRRWMRTIPAYYLVLLALAL